MFRERYVQNLSKTELSCISGKVYSTELSFISEKIYSEKWHI